MLALHVLFILLHIITASAWFGIGLRIAGEARSAVDAPPERGALLAAQVTRSAKLMNLFVVLTLVFALGAFFVGGGFAVYGPQYHTSITLMLLLIAVQFLLVSRPWQKVTAGDPKAVRRIPMGVGIGHLLWLIILVLMFWVRIRVIFA